MTSLELLKQSIEEMVGDAFDAEVKEKLYAYDQKMDWLQQDLKELVQSRAAAKDFAETRVAVTKIIKRIDILEGAFRLTRQRARRLP